MTSQLNSVLLIDAMYMIVEEHDSQQLFLQYGVTKMASGTAEQSKIRHSGLRT